MSEQELIDKSFAAFAVCQALPRANEALALSLIKFRKPILDLGCGDGRFGEVFFGKGVSIGLDSDPQEAEKAKERGVYEKVVVADGAKMPFKNGVFSTIVSNSVLEHVANLDRVLTEVYRVMHKNGIFVFTVPTPLVCQYQFWARFIPGYALFKRKLWRHINYFGEREWRHHLAKAGFKIREVKRTNSKKAIAWADIFFPLFFLGPMKWPLSILSKRGVFGEERKGATLVIVACKDR